MSLLRLTLTGHGNFDGAYDLDLEANPLTKREWHWIKEIANVRPGTFSNALESGDTDLDVAFQVIAVIRSGKANKQQFHMLKEFFLDSSGDMDVEEVVTEEDDARPPGQETLPLSESGSSEKPTSSSVDSNGTGTDLPETDQVFTGQPS